MLKHVLEPDLAAARRHLLLVTGEPDPLVSWQTFHDSNKSRGGLARSFHGRLTDVLPKLKAAQQDGCGVFFAINRTDGKARKKANMKDTRVLFLDLDGAPLPDPWPVEPDLIVRTSSPAAEASARALLSEESNWHRTNDGGVSVFKMACRLRGLGISPELAVELLTEHLPIAPVDNWPADHIEKKVANAFRYAAGEAGEHSIEALLHDFDDEPLDPESLASLSGVEDRAKAEKSQADRAHRFKLWEVEELAALPPVEWLADGLLIERGLAQIYGPAKTHKTFVTLDLMLCIATGRPFHGVPVKRGRIVYVIAEGQSDFYDRVAAWCFENKVEVPELRGWFRVVISPVAVDDFARDGALTGFLNVAAKSAPFDAFVFDTANRNMEGDENDTKAMSRFVKGCDVIRQKFESAVIVIHHTGWNTQRPRGSSVLLAAVDVSLQVTRPNEKELRTKLLVEHIRAAPAGKVLYFDPAIVVTDFERGRDSLVMRLADAPERVPSKKEEERRAREAACDGLLKDIHDMRPKLQKDLIRDEAYRSQTMVSTLVRELREDGWLEGDSLQLTDRGLDRLEEIQGNDAADVQAHDAPDEDEI